MLQTHNESKAHEHVMKTRFTDVQMANSCDNEYENFA